METIKTTTSINGSSPVIRFFDNYYPKIYKDPIDKRSYFVRILSELYYSNEDITIVNFEVIGTLDGYPPCIASGRCTKNDISDFEVKPIEHKYKVSLLTNEWEYQ